VKGKPFDAKTIRRFLLQKGLNTAPLTSGLSDSEMLEVATAIADLAINLPEGLKLVKGGPSMAFVGVGLVVSDAIRPV